MLRGGPCPDIVKGHNDGLGCPPVSEKVLPPPSTFVAGSEQRVGGPVEGPSQPPSAHSDLDINSVCSLPHPYRHLALQGCLVGTDGIQQVDLRLLAMQQYFDIWKAPALRRTDSCGEAKGITAVDALLEGVPLKNQMRWARFLDQCHKDKADLAATIAVCFLRWQGQARRATCKVLRKPAKRKAKRANRSLVVHPHCAVAGPVPLPLRPVGVPPLDADCGVGLLALGVGFCLYSFCSIHSTGSLGVRVPSQPLDCHVHALVECAGAKKGVSV